MRRRDVTVGGIAVACAAIPVALALRAAFVQKSSKAYRVGILSAGADLPPGHEAFDATLANLGYQEGRNLMIERRYAAGDLNRLPALAADLVRTNVDVIVTVMTPAAVAAKQATATIPIVMATGGDPVGSGLVASLARPGGNVTGLSSFDSLIDGKKVELLRELKPDARRLAYVGNSQIIAEQTGFREVATAATAAGMEATFVNAPSPETVEHAFEAMAAARLDVAIVPPSAPNTEARARIATIAARYRLPAAYGDRVFVDAGGLISYGTSRASLFARAAVFTDRILKGANPADLPVEQPRQLELVINLKTARTLGLTVPRSLLARADEVIE
jgi:putative ABC transport system substrate-binding protein